MMRSKWVFQETSEYQDKLVDIYEAGADKEYDKAVREIDELITKLEQLKVKLKEFKNAI